MSDWERNVWTGHDKLRVSKAGRVLRQKYADGTFLYWAEWWGDFSLRFPVRGEYRKTLSDAQKDLKRLSSRAGGQS